MEICRVTMINKGIEYQCNFYVVSGNGPSLLGMPDHKWLHLLSINCQTANRQCKEDKLMRKQSKVNQIQANN